MHRNYQLVEVELIPRYFKDDDEFRELISDVYPILKLLLKFNSQKTQNDHSLRNVLSHKMSEASKDIQRRGS
jgi:hypothetical protein